MENKDPILAALAGIEAKIDQTLKNQQEINSELEEIRKDTKRAAAVVGGASGAVAASAVSLFLEFVRRTMGA